VIERELTDVLQRWGSGAAGDRPRVRGPRSPSRGRAARSTSASRIRRFRTISRSCARRGWSRRDPTAICAWTGSTARSSTSVSRGCSTRSCGWPFRP